jgi:hypothetical protein
VIETLLQIWRWLKYRRAAFVSSRDELEAALRRAPPRIIVEGNEALRAYAATLAHRGGEHAAALEASAPPPGCGPTYMVVPTIGRIRDGYRHRRPTEKKRSRFRLKAGMGTVVIAAVGIAAALLVELISLPVTEPQIIRGPRHAGVALLRRHQEIRLPTRAPPPPPPPISSQIEAVAIPVLLTLAVAALLYLAWQAIGPNRPVRISWRVEHRIQGRLVIARVRTRIA